MSRRTQVEATLTPTATADTTNLVDNTYPHLLQGGSGTQVNFIWEVSIQGQETSTSSPTFFQLAYDSQVGTGSNTRGSGQTDTAVNPATAALASIPLTGNQFATNKPQRSTSLKLASYSINALSGAAFWRANKVDECWQTLGNTASVGEISLSAYTGGTTGHCGSHLVYESL